MIAGMNSRVLRSHPATIGVRQHVAARTNPAMSKRMARMVTLILCVGLFVVFSLNQFLHWQIMASTNRLDQLQSVRNKYGSENISLLATRAQIVSKKSVMELAGKKFQLFVPGKDQVQRL